MANELPLCACGCGEPVSKVGNRFINGHTWKGKEKGPLDDSHRTAISKALKGHSVSEDTRKKIAKRHKGVPMSDSARASMSRSKKGTTFSKEHKAAISKWQKEHPQTGEDIVNHHYIYDHSDLNKYTIEITKSKHMKLHQFMRKAKIIVPHINIKEKCQ